MTMSIVAYDPITGDLGAAVQSKFPCVGGMVPWAKAGVGAVATQAMANTSFGPRGLDLMSRGLSAQDALEQLLTPDPDRERRQVALVDAKGKVAAHTGGGCFNWAGHVTGQHYSCQGNILVSKKTVDEMAQAYEENQGDLAGKLLAALAVGDRPQRGDVRGKQSAALLVVREGGGYCGYDDRMIDIRVDDHPEPIQELHRLFKIYDMTFLSREPDSALMDLAGPVAEKVKSVLLELNYLDPAAASPGHEWGGKEASALEAWTGINNFENKWRGGDKIWRSVFDYITSKKGTPFVDLGTD
jgi:uncharacterized Ntn-hydrolase superfamily protein